MDADVLVSKVSEGRTDFSNLIITGDVDLGDLEIDGDLNFGGSIFKNGLNMVRMVIRGNLILKGVHIFHNICLSGARINVILDIRDMQMFGRHARNADLTEIWVKGHILAGGDETLIGTCFDLSKAEVGGKLDISGNAKVNSCLKLDEAKVRGDVNLTGVHVVDTLSLRDAIFGSHLHLVNALVGDFDMHGAEVGGTTFWPGFHVRPDLT